MTQPQHYLLASSALFSMGLMVIIVRRHRLVVLMGVELMLQGVNLALVALTSWFQDWSGEVMVLLVMVVAAVELTAGIGAALVHRQQARPQTSRAPRP